MIIWTGPETKEEKDTTMKLKIIVNIQGMTGRILRVVCREIEIIANGCYNRDLMDRINYGLPKAVQEQLAKPDYELEIGHPLPDTRRGILMLRAPK